MHGPTHGRFQEFPTTTLQVAQALLVKRLLEAVVSTPAIVDQRAGPVRAEQLFRKVATAVADLVASSGLAHEGVQPGAVPAHAPARFVGHDPRRLTHGQPQLIVGGLGPPRGPQQAADARGSRDPDVEEFLEELPALAVRQAESLVQSYSYANSRSKLGCGVAEVRAFRRASVGGDSGQAGAPAVYQEGDLLPLTAGTSMGCRTDGGFHNPAKPAAIHGNPRR